MRKVFSKLFFALMLVAGLSFVSCNDDDGDDKKNNNNEGGTTITDPSGAVTSIYFTYSDCINMTTQTKDNIKKTLTQKGFSLLEEGNEDGEEYMVYSLNEENGDFQGIEFDFDDNGVTYCNYVIGSDSEKLKNVYPTLVNQSYDFMKSRNFTVFSLLMSLIQGSVFYADSDYKTYSNIEDFLKAVDMVILPDISSMDWTYSDKAEEFYSDVYFVNANSLGDDELLEFGNYLVSTEIEFSRNEHVNLVSRKRFLKRNAVALR